MNMDTQFKYLQQVATDFHQYNQKPEQLYEALNKLPKEILNDIFDEYGRIEKFKPVNLLRAEVALRIKEGQQVNAEEVELIKERIRRRDTEYFSHYAISVLKELRAYPKDGKRDIFANWQNPWSVFHTFFFRGAIKKNSQEYLQILGKRLMEDVGLEGYSVHIVDFFGPNNFGSDFAWLALYPTRIGTHRTSYQFFLRISADSEAGRMAGHSMASAVPNKLRQIRNYHEVKQFFQSIKEEVETLNTELEEAPAISQNVDYWLIAPGENARLWEEFYEQGIVAIGWDKLGDLRQYPDKFAIGDRINEVEGVDGRRMNDQLACWEFVHAIKPGDIVISKAGRASYLGWGIVSSDYRYEPERSEYPNVRSVEWQAKGVWESDFPLVMKTVTGISKYPHYVRKLKALLGIEAGAEETLTISSETGQQFWWLNANPKIWGIDQTKIGEAQTYTSHNDKGNKRQKYRYFTQVKPGDIVVGYETTPVKKIKALFEITEALHQHPTEGELFSFRKTEDLRQPIDYDTLKGLPALKDCEPLHNNQGSLFQLTEEEFDVIRDIIDTKITEAEQAEKTAKPYTKEDALKDLFMGEETFDRMVRALAYKKNIVLQGAPGVGKTFVAKRLAQYLIKKEDPWKIRTVQFHQSFSYEEFIMGIRPNEDGKFDRKKGLLYEFAERAQADTANPYFLIIDEINRGNLGKIFGELMLLIEADKRGKKHEMPLMYSKDDESFYLPENLHFIGTMNTADRSLALVDYALRRRFAFIDLDPEFGERFEAHLHKKDIPAKLVSRIIQNIKTVNQGIENDLNLGKGFMIGHSYFCQLENLEGWASPEDWYRDIVEWELAPQLREYWFDNSDKANEAVATLLNL